MSVTLENKTTAADRVAALSARLDGQQPLLREIRERGLAAFARMGFPTTRDEAWRFTSVAPIARAELTLAEPAPVAATAVEPFTAAVPTMVFVNGFYSPALSTLGALTGVTATTLSRACQERLPAALEHLGRHAASDRRPFPALGDALLADGALLAFAPGTIVDSPIQILWVSTPGNGGTAVSSPRLLVVSGAGSHARIVETFLGVGEGPYLTNAVSEIAVGENATLDHYKVQLEGEAAWHVGALAFDATRNSQITSHSLSLGGSLVRTDIDVLLAGEGAGCVLNGLYLTGGEQHVDHHTLIDHATPHCDSQEFYKGILDDRSRAVFDGAIIVRKDAQKTSSGQVNRNLILSGDAMVDSKPQLEIYADDVKCTHGSTIGQLDENSMFYLRSRGIGAVDARNILTWAFASEVVERVKVPLVRQVVESALLERLPRIAMEPES